MIHQVLCHDLSHQLIGFVGSLPAVIHQGEGDGLFDVFGFGLFHGGKIAEGTYREQAERSVGARFGPRFQRFHRAIERQPPGAG